MDGSMTGSQKSKLSNLKDSMKSANLDPRMEVTQMHIKLWVTMRQHLQQHRQLLMYTKHGAMLLGSRTKNKKISTSDMTVVTWFRFTVKLVREQACTVGNCWTSMEWAILFQSILKRMLSISTWTEKWSLKKPTAWATPSRVLRRRINSRETSLAERIARKSNDNSRLRCTTHLWWHRASGGISCRCRNRKRRRKISRRGNSYIHSVPEESYE